VAETKVYLEIGQKRTFAGAVDWPGWTRSARDEGSALAALIEYAPRYARIVKPAYAGFDPPKDVKALAVVERLEGDATTDFGAPSITPSADSAAFDAKDLSRAVAILRACWRAFDVAVSAAEGKELRKGPRGGGRELAKIMRHVLDSEAGYARQIGQKADLKEFEGAEDIATMREALAHGREAVVAGLTTVARDGIPETGPRGGTRWKPRYFVRRAAWHVVDHLWEIEDRSA
jgi:hypothetical protein